MLKTILELYGISEITSDVWTDIIAFMLFNSDILSILSFNISKIFMAVLMIFSSFTYIVISKFLLIYLFCIFKIILSNASV